MPRDPLLPRRDPWARARVRHAVTVLLLAMVTALVLPCMALGQVATRDLARNTALATSDVAASPGNAAGELAVALPIGWVTRRAIRAGERLAPPAVVPPRLVRRGETVTLLYDDGALQVSRRGDALRDAALHETCAVRVAPATPGQPHVVLAGRVIREGVVALDRSTPSTR